MYRISSYKTRRYFFFQGLQLRLLLEHGYYSRERIDIGKQQSLNLEPVFLILKQLHGLIQKLFAQFLASLIDKQQLIAIKYQCTNLVIGDSFMSQPMT